MGLDILSVLDSELGTGGGKETPGWLRSVTTLQRPQPNWGGGHPLHHNTHEPTEDEFGAQGRCLRNSKSRPGKGSGSGGDPRQVVLDREASWGGRTGREDASTSGLCCGYLGLSPSGALQETVAHTSELCLGGARKRMHPSMPCFLGRDTTKFLTPWLSWPVLAMLHHCWRMF